MKTENSKHDQYYIDWYNKQENQAIGAQKIIGWDKLLSDLRTPGIYEIRAEQIDPKTGMTKKSLKVCTGESRDCGIRALENCKRWLGAITENRGNFFEYYTGVPYDSTWKIRFSLIAAGEDYSDTLKRIERERQELRACNPRPFLQETCGGKFPLYTPRAPEDCHIAPYNGARKRAFEAALKRQYGEETK